mmetsp:Transcript_34880/g.108485  ORF Transcript_34880/g.108485 Transcript_34880/m.108485 type:complete len:263 (+) Transcript_34880:95-883(+)
MMPEGANRKGTSVSAACASGDADHVVGLDHDLVLRLEAVQARAELVLGEGQLALRQARVHARQEVHARHLLPPVPREGACDERREDVQPARADVDGALVDLGRSHTVRPVLARPLLAAARRALSVVVVARRRGAVVAAGGSHRLLDLLLSRGEEELVGCVHVLLEDLVLAELELRMRRCQPDKPLQGTRGDGQPRLLVVLRGALHRRVAHVEAHAHVHVLLCDLRLRGLAEHRRQALAVAKVLAQEVHGEDLRGRLTVGHGQ